MADNEAKPWKCENGHIMGQVVRNGSGIRQLLFYRQAVDLNAPAESFTPVEVMGMAEGLVLDLACSVCGCVRTWVPGEEAIRRLLKRYGGKVGELNR